jgi:hypothetical protein
MARVFSHWRYKQNKQNNLGLYIMMNQENSSVNIKHVLIACAILLRCPHGAFDRQMIEGSSRAPLR